MCNRPPVHVPGNCPPIPGECPVNEFVRMAREAFEARREDKTPVDPRDAELATLRAQLADAKAVIEAARVAECQLSGANLALWASGDAEEEELAEANEAAQELRARLADYDAKHGAK